MASDPATPLERLAQALAEGGQVVPKPCLCPAGYRGGVPACKPSRTGTKALRSISAPERRGLSSCTDSSWRCGSSYLDQGARSGRQFSILLSAQGGLLLFPLFSNQIWPGRVVGSVLRDPYTPFSHLLFSCPSKVLRAALTFGREYFVVLFGVSSLEACYDRGGTFSPDVFCYTGLDS